MKEKEMKKLSLFITVVIVGIVVWFLVIFPLIKFKKMENEFGNTISIIGFKYKNPSIILNIFFSMNLFIIITLFLIKFIPRLFKSN